MAFRKEKNESKRTTPRYRAGVGGHISISWKLFAYLAVFTAFILVVVWVMQIGLLNHFYRQSKHKELNTADTVIVGMYKGDLALSAVGSSMPILNLLLALFVGVATGAGIVVSQRFGAKDREGLSIAIGNCITLSAIATVVIMIIGPFITRPLLNLLKTPDTIIDWCAQYLTIYFVGIVGFFFYNMLSGILRGLGDSFTALMFLLVSAALNVGLDLLFVAVFKWGIASAAAAISSSLSGGLLKV
jgi:Na+-driven multidrug efflux pump